MKKYLVLLWLFGFSISLNACSLSSQPPNAPLNGSKPTPCPTQEGNPEGKCIPNIKGTAAGANSQPTDLIGTIIRVNGGSYSDVSVDDLKNLLTKKDFLLINVHIPYEGNLPETDLSIPYDQIDLNITKLPADKKAKIVLYCRSGRMSTIAAEEMVRLGYTHIMNLKGGMNAWENAGLRIEK